MKYFPPETVFHRNSQCGPKEQSRCVGCVAFPASVTAGKMEGGI